MRRDVGRDRVADVVGRSGDRRDRSDRVRRRAAIVVAHDHDRVGAARGGRLLDRVVADPAGRVERQLVAACDLVQLGPDRPDERGELVGVGRDDRLEVEVDAVGAAVADGRRDLAGEVGPVARAAEERLLAGDTGRRPGEALDGQDDPRAAGVGRVDDRRSSSSSSSRSSRPSSSRRCCASGGCRCRGAPTPK